MKKIIMAMGTLALLMGATSCSNDNSKKEAAEAQASEAAPVEQQLTPAQANAKAGQEFIEGLQKSDSTIVVTESGLAYKVLKEGKGAKPAANSTVKVDYTGKHIDGSVFDSSEGNPISFNLQQVIPGFSEGLMQMNKGAVYELYIPGNLAYGPNGIPNLIAPNELLIFEIELVDFE